MSYTPINWQAGDTITAAKLNRCDNGWGVESTQLFSETVTTVDQGGMVMGTLPYSSQIDTPTLTVTFDGTDYTCPAIEMNGAYGYGGVGQTGPDFTDFPFLIISSVDGGGSNELYTETAGSHTVAATGPAVVVSSNFGTAVGKCLPILKVRLGITTYQEAVDALGSGFLVYGYDEDHGRLFYAVRAVDDPENSEYTLYALTMQQGALSFEMASFVAESINGPLN